MAIGAGTKIGRYTLRRKVSAGGMGEVWEAVDPNLDRTVAVKIIFEQFASDADFRARFLREAHTVAKLEHPHIVAIYDFDPQECRWLVMPLLLGGSLQDRLKKEITRSDAISYLREIASALDFAHRKGVIHRDVKPGNVLFTADGHLYVTDFGLAKSVDDTRLTSSGMAMGTPGYMAPEQIRGVSGPAGDQYALAVLAYRMLTGRLPFAGESAIEIAVKTLQEPTPPASTWNPTLSSSIDGVLARALSKEPSERYLSCSEMVAALESSFGAEVESTVGVDDETLQLNASSIAPGRSTPAHRTPPPLLPAPTTLLATNGVPRSRLSRRLLVVATVVVAGIVAAVLLLRQRSSTPAAVLPPPVPASEPRRPLSATAAPSAAPIVASEPDAVPTNSVPQEAASVEPASPPETAVESRGASSENDSKKPDSAVSGKRGSGAPGKLSALGERRINAKDGLAYDRIPAGRFEMGCVPSDEKCAPNERPRHTVRITRAFWMGHTEVTVEAYRRFADASRREMPPSPKFKQGPRHPIVNVSWDDAKAYCTWSGGRLPTEAEWEYAARAGNDGWKYVWGNQEVPIVDGVNQANGLGAEDKGFKGYDDGAKHTSAVASYAPNRFGLFDMAGNVYEWCQDFYSGGFYAQSPGSDPRGPERGRERIVRGGGWFSGPYHMRVSFRGKPEDERSDKTGFRCVIDGPLP